MNTIIINLAKKIQTVLSKLKEPVDKRVRKTDIHHAVLFRLLYCKLNMSQDSACSTINMFTGKKST